MCKTSRLNKEDIIASSSLLRMDHADAISEIVDTLFEFKTYADHQNLKFLTYLLDMAEAEAGQIHSSGAGALFDATPDGELSA